jgi:DNA-binding GntR family transcriptional regulator
MQGHRHLLVAFRKEHPEEAEMLMKEHLIRQSEALAGLYSETLYSSLSLG